MKIGFSYDEGKIILAVIVIFSIGLAAKYIINIKEINTPKDFNYETEDSLYYSALENQDSILFAGKILEKGIDSERELLDFSTKNKSFKKNSVSGLTERSINLNTAKKDSLTLLPGIGDKTAEKIITLRMQKGSFKKIEELLEIRGIGKKKLEDIRKYLFIE